MKLGYKWTCVILAAFMSLVCTSSSMAKASVAVASSLSQARYALQPGPNNNANLAIKTPQQAMQRVRSQYQAKVLTIQASQVNGNSGYRVKLLTAQGEVFYVLVDAKTGAISRH